MARPILVVALGGVAEEEQPLLLLLQYLFSVLFLLRILAGCPLPIATAILHWYVCNVLRKSGLLRSR